MKPGYFRITSCALISDLDCYFDYNSYNFRQLCPILHRGMNGDEHGQNSIKITSEMDTPLPPANPHIEKKITPDSEAPALTPRERNAGKR